jgi:drug/metabolite transporter (DMT)-like permease
MTSSDLALAAALLITDSLHFVFARMLLPHISPGVSAMYVLAIATVEVGAFGLLRRKLRLGTFARHMWLFLALGLLVGSSTNMNYEAVAFIDPGTASLLGKTSILFGLVFGLLWLREKLTLRQVVGSLIAMVGVIVVTFQPGDYLRLGSLLLLASTLAYALHAALAKRYGSQIEFLDFFFFRLLCTTGALFLISLVRGALVWPSGTAWLLLILVGTVDVVVSRTLYYMVLRRSKLSVFNIVLTVSPVVTIAWSLLLFGTVPTAQQIIGGAAVILGVLLVTLRPNAS